MTERYTSLGEFERRHGIHKGTVSKRAREMGFDTASGLSPTAYEAMKKEFGVKDGGKSQEIISAPVPITYGGHPLTLRAGGLIPRTGESTMIPHRFFDVEGYRGDKTALAEEAQQKAAALNDAITAYAKAKVASVLADVDLVGDAIRANALEAMGVEAGKSDGPAAA